MKQNIFYFISFIADKTTPIKQKSYANTWFFLVAEWCSGKVLDLRSTGCGFNSNRDKDA